MTREKFVQIIKQLIKDANDETAITAKDFYPDWAVGREYKTADRVLYQGTLFSCLQAHTSQATWNPKDAVSLWAEVLVPTKNEIPDWKQPDSTNPYKAGDRVKHNGKIWVSTIDSNVWAPGAVGTETLWTELV